MIEAVLNPQNPISYEEVQLFQGLLRALRSDKLTDSEKLKNASKSLKIFNTTNKPKKM